MLLKLGVDIGRLERPTRRALSVVEGVFAGRGQEAVVTSTYEGNHSPGSLHYANAAFDVRRPFQGAEGITQEIAKVLGPQYDVVLEATHIHVEWDPPSAA